MEIPSRNPNQVQPETLAKVIRAAHSVLEQAGVESHTALAKIDGKYPDMVSATVPIESSALTQVPEGIMPTVSINRPIGDFARRARWAYEITYGMQNASASRHIIVLNGEIPQAEMSFYDGQSDRPLTEPEAQAVVSDLSRVAKIEV